MSSSSISSIAHTKIVNHALSHPTCPVHGALIGTQSSTGKLEITDVAPISHTHLTSLLIEGGMTLAEEVFCNNGGSIVGWYVCNERLTDNNPPESVLKVMDKISAIAGENNSTLLVVVNNKKITSDSTSLQCFVKDTRGRHLKTVDPGQITIGDYSKSLKGDVSRVFDFEDQMEEIDGADWRNSN
jgi:hypothetical protein